MITKGQIEITEETVEPTGLPRMAYCEGNTYYRDIGTRVTANVGVYAIHVVPHDDLEYGEDKDRYLQYVKETLRNSIMNEIYASKNEQIMFLERLLYQLPIVQARAAMVEYEYKRREKPEWNL